MIKEEYKDRVYNFLREYEAICQKYDMGIDACGCCNSPYLYKKDCYNLELVLYNPETQKIEWDGGLFKTFTLENIREELEKKGEWLR